MSKPFEEIMIRTSPQDPGIESWLGVDVYRRHINVASYPNDSSECFGTWFGSMNIDEARELVKALNKAIRKVAA